MSRVYCHYQVPLFISKDVRSGAGTRRPCSEYIIEPSLKRCSITDTPNIQHPSAKNRKWVHCYPCDCSYCPKHASVARNIQHDTCRITARISVERKKSKRKAKSPANEPATDKPSKQAIQAKEPKKQPFSLSKARSDSSKRTDAFSRVSIGSDRESNSVSASIFVVLAKSIKV